MIHKATKNLEFRAEVSRGILYIVKGDMVHLMFKLQDFVALHSWVNDGFGRIEITLKTGEILAEYDTPEKWGSVLRLLSKTIGDYV